ncbi:hypothetical protein M4951_02840 [Blastopirellula sp. J2-11]|uniref:hypothetical protein n=1 Tax=Blastopirellula sp. J2-11 TaxID=2943192 RepID=UPI0021C67D42|nr:hypothetical protein [Blastopirellula sp. J2-11]UUO07253.1 hypothetical protein M4951_02840 [Blastopirellula sp. J2-11]
MAPHLRVYFGPEDELTPSDGSDLAEIVLGDSTRTAALTPHAGLAKSGAAQPAAAEIAVGLEELLQLLDDARRCGVTIQDEVEHETVMVSRDLFRALLAYQTLLQPQASSQ